MRFGYHRADLEAAVRLTKLVDEIKEVNRQNDILLDMVTRWHKGALSTEDFQVALDQWERGNAA